MTTTSFLSLLTEDERTRLLMGAERTTHDQGKVLLLQGDPGSSMLIIEDGTVDVTRSGSGLATLGRGDAIGEMALLDPAPRSATVVATSEVTTIELERDVVWGLLADGDPAAVKVLQSITATVCAASRT